MNTTEFLTIASAIVPERTAIVFDKLRYSFFELQQRSNKLSNAFYKLGLKAKDRIAIMEVNTPEFIESYIACSKLDGIFVPFNYRAQANEIIHMINSTEPTILVVGQRYEELIRSILPQVDNPIHIVSINDSDTNEWLNYSDILESSSESELHFPEGNDDDTNLLMFTAGTTGSPKAVMLTHESFSSFMLSNVEPADPESVESTLLSVPLYHIAGMQSLLAAIYGGRTLVIMRQFEAEQWMKLVEEEKVARTIVVPTMLKQVIDHPKFKSYNLSSLKIVTYGAAPMPLELIKRAVTSLPNARFMNAFGQTETASTITMLPPDDHDLTGTPEEIEKKLKHLTSVGKPLPDVEVAIVDENGDEVPIGNVGDIAARGSRLMKGYWKDNKATSDTIHGGWLYTGDLGYRDEDGYIFLTGRSKDFIKRGGEMISPEEVEQALMSHEAVDDAAIIGVPDNQWGESVRAIVVLHKGHDVTEQEIVEHCRHYLASFKKPESVVFVNELPRNPLGKVLKRVLKESHGYPTISRETHGE